MLAFSALSLHFFFFSWDLLLDPGMGNVGIFNDLENSLSALRLTVGNLAASLSFPLKPA